MSFSITDLIPQPLLDLGEDLVEGVQEAAEEIKALFSPENKLAEVAL